jgi:hypothetical protein
VSTYGVQRVDQKGTVEKYQKMHHTLLCEYCKSMGHDVNNCQSLQLRQDNTHDVFQVQEQHKGRDCGGAERGGYQRGPRGRYGRNRGGGCGGGGRPRTCFNCCEIGHVLIFCTKLCALYGHCYSPEHVTEDCPDL